MNLELQTPNLAGKSFDCECGKSHSVPVELVEISRGALNRLSDFVSSRKLGKRALLVADSNTWEVAGEIVEKNLVDAGIAVDRSIFRTRDPIHADEAAIFKVLADFDPRHDFLVAVGSGTINDITKFVSFKVGRPYVVCATAPSMDGYTSTVSPLTVGGFKKTYYVGCPIAVFADLDILVRAPDNLVISGAGDLIGKITAGADWILSKTITGEYYCPRISGMMKTAVDRCIESAPGLAGSSPEAMALLTDGLLLSGLAMLMGGSSRPASGAEHLAAHYWEIKGFVREKKWDLHGVRVGVATLLALRFYEKLLSIDISKLGMSSLRKRFLTPERRKQLVAEAYGPMAEQAFNEAAAKYVEWEQRRDRLNLIKSRWDAVRSEVSGWIEKGPDAETTLRTIGAPLTPRDLSIRGQDLSESLLMCKEMRGRYTVFDLGEELGMLDDWISGLE